MRNKPLDPATISRVVARYRALCATLPKGKAQEQTGTEFGINPRTVRVYANTPVTVQASPQQIVSNDFEWDEEIFEGIEITTAQDYEIPQPKILCYDIEIAPSIGYVWQKYEANVLEFISEFYILSWSAKWLNGDQITKALPDYEGYEKGTENDYALVADLWKLMNEADVVIAHNACKFDNRRTNVQFISNGLPPPRPFKTIDTLQVARKHFGFLSNKLDDLGVKLGLGRKEKTGGFDLWKSCLHGDMDAWASMKRYNERDTVLLEQVYLKMRPWMDSHPNLNVLMGREYGCSRCGSTNLEPYGKFLTATGRSSAFQCKDCTAIVKGKHVKVATIR